MKLLSFSASPSVILFSVACLLLPAIPLSAQTIFVPGGAVGNITGGNVGIGNSNPNFPLTVSGIVGIRSDASAAPVVLVGRASDNLNQILAENNAENVYTGRISFGGNGDLSLDTGSILASRIFVQNSTGNVGIGTVTPSAKLQVEGRGMFVSPNSGTTGGVVIRDAAGNPGNPILQFVDNAVGVQYGYIQGLPQGGLMVGGKVGVGTTTPSTALDVVGGITVRADAGGQAFRALGRLDDGFAWAPLVMTNAGTGYTGGVYFTPGTAALCMGNSLAPIMYWLSNGSVGIGTATPGTYKFAVNGAIHAKEVVVDTTGWSDYVFKRDYKLASLSEVEGAIARDGHLPGIPSAQEVAEHGVSVGEMQSKLLAKIEELTLHQIDQEKRLVAQQNEIAALRNRLGEIVPK